MKNNFSKINKKRFLKLVKKDPLLTLIVVAILILFINILISLILGKSTEVTLVEEEAIPISVKSSDLNLKPDDFPEVSGFLKLLPEYNEYFGVSNFPLTKDENLKVLVELYSNDSRKIFDDWIRKFTNQKKIEFIFQENSEGKQLGFSLARTKYSTLLALLPYNSNEFTITGKFDVDKGVKFKIFFNKNDSNAISEAEKFINEHNLYKESLSIEYIGPFLESLD